MTSALAQRPFAGAGYGSSERLPLIISCPFSIPLVHKRSLTDCRFQEEV